MPQPRYDAGAVGFDDVEEVGEWWGQPVALGEVVADEVDSDVYVFVAFALEFEAVEVCVFGEVWLLVAALVADIGLFPLDLGNLVGLQRCVAIEFDRDLLEEVGQARALRYGRLRCFLFLVHVLTILSIFGRSGITVLLAIGIKIVVIVKQPTLDFDLVCGLRRVAKVKGFIVHSHLLPRLVLGGVRYPYPHRFVQLMSALERILVLQPFAHHDGVEVLLSLPQVAVPLDGIANDGISNALGYLLVGWDLAACSGRFAPLGIELLLLLNLLLSGLRRSSTGHNGAGPCFTESLGQLRKSNTARGSHGGEICEG